MEKLQKLGLPILVGGLILFIFLAKTFVNIGYGEAGVLFKTFGNGVVTDEPPLDEGLRFILPWNSVFIYEVRLIKFIMYLFIFIFKLCPISEFLS